MSSFHLRLLSQKFQTHPVQNFVSLKSVIAPPPSSTLHSSIALDIEMLYFCSFFLIEEYFVSKIVLSVVNVTFQNKRFLGFGAKPTAYGDGLPLTKAENPIFGQRISAGYLLTGLSRETKTSVLYPSEIRISQEIRQNSVIRISRFPLGL